MQHVGSEGFGYLLYHYFVEWHPVFILYNLGTQYEAGTASTGIWLLTAVMGITVWFALARLIAEVPGRRHGNMLIWWVIFAALHLWSLPIYIVYDIVSTITRKQHQVSKKKKYADRTASEIRTNTKDSKFKHLPEEFK